MPEPFRAALVGLRAALAAPDRAGLDLQEVPGPKRLAPYAVAVSAEICRDDEPIELLSSTPVTVDGHAGTYTEWECTPASKTLVRQWNFPDKRVVFITTRPLGQGGSRSFDIARAVIKADRQMWPRR